MDIEQMIADNIGLVYHFLHKFNLAYDDEAYCYAVEGLMKAAQTFAADKGSKFSTYAGVCIYNQLGMYWRRLRKENKLDTVSLDAPIGDNLRLSDTLPDYNTPDVPLLQAELNRKLIDVYINIVKAMPKGPAKTILQCWLDSGFTAKQRELSEAAGVSQAHVSRTLSALKHKIKRELEDYVCMK